MNTNRGKKPHQQ